MTINDPPSGETAKAAGCWGTLMVVVRLSVAVSITAMFEFVKSDTYRVEPSGEKARAVG